MAMTTHRLSKAVAVLKPELVPNTGSNARDFCMLERNLLSHVKLALLLSLLSSSLLLRTRLVPEPSGPSATQSKSSFPLAGVEISASLATIIAGAWQYQSGYRDLRNTRAFLMATNPHLIIMAVVVVTVFATCIVLIANGP